MINYKFLKEIIKDRIRYNFISLKQKSGQYRLYKFILKRVCNVDTIFYATSATLKSFKNSFDQNEKYQNIWTTKEISLNADNLNSLENKITKVLKEMDNDEINILLINSLKELKVEGLFNTEIPEFAIYIQDQNKNEKIENLSYEIINGKSYYNNFKNRFINNSYSLTNMLLDRYSLR